MVTAWEKKILLLVSYIPPGKVITYKELARAAGTPKGCRAVGNSLNKNPWAPSIPCHRVVKSNGEVGGFAHGQKKKMEYLSSEGVDIQRGKITSPEFFISGEELSKLK